MEVSRPLGASQSDSKLARPASQQTNRRVSAQSGHSLTPQRKVSTAWGHPSGSGNNVASSGSRRNSSTASRPGSQAGSRTPGKQANSATPPTRRRVVWSPEKLVPLELEELGRHDRGLYFTTNRENKSKEKISNQLDMSHELKSLRDGEHSTSHHELDSPGGAKETIETVTAAFKMEVGEIDRQLEEIHKSLSMNHLHGDQELAAERARQKAEALKREQMAAERRARDKEKAARDPHRKIEIRLENKRRFEMDKLDTMGIPVSRVDFQGHAGREQYSLVDVRALKCKCQGLNEGARTVPELVELQHRKEKAALNLSTIPSSPGSTMSSMPVFAMTSSMFSNDSGTPSHRSWEDNSEKARVYRQCLLAEKTVYKLNLMKNPPERIPHGYDVFEHCAEDTRGDWEFTDFGTIRKKGETSSDADRRKGHSSDADSPFGKMGTGAVRKGRRGALLSLGHRRGSIKPQKAEPVSDAVLQRVKHLWKCFRGVVWYLTVYFAHMRRTESAETLRRFVRQLGEWSRIKRAIKKLAATVKILQKTCRTFLAIKGKRCDMMQKEFQRAEDSYLQNFFRLYAHKALEEHYKEIEDANSFVTPTGKTVLRSSHKKLTHMMSREQSNQFVDQSFDWKSYRIPVNIRKAIISRYYLYELAKHLQSREDLLFTIQQTVEFQKDLSRTMKFFGVDVDVKQKRWQGKVVVTGDELMMPEFWHLTEDVVIDLVCTAAQSLFTSKDTTYSKFKEHPANKGDRLHEREYDDYCRPPRPLPNETRAALSVGLEHKVITSQDLREAEVNLAAKRASGGAEVKAAAKKGATTVAAAGRRQLENTAVSTVTFAGESTVDLDDICGNFTPRLKEMAQEHLAAEG